MGIYRREMLVLSTCLAFGYPVATVIGGGYSSNMPELIARHSFLYRAATQCYRKT